MKNGLLILNVILLIAVGVLFYLHFSKPKTTTTVAGTQLSGGPDLSNGASTGRIAYIEMDSVENASILIKNVRNELARKEEAMTNEMSGLEKKYRTRATELGAQPMNQVQSEAAQKEMFQLEQQIRGRKQELDQVYQNMYMDKMKDVKSKIETFLKEYNKDKRYTYILAYDPGIFYYKDSTYNITNDVIKGLNERYQK
jgi:outer membrane protein